MINGVTISDSNGEGNIIIETDGGRMLLYFSVGEYRIGILIQELGDALNFFLNDKKKKLLIDHINGVKQRMIE